MNRHPEIAIIGPLPPPWGGVAVHIERLMGHLDREGISYRVYNTAGPTAIPGRAVSVAADRDRWFARYLLKGEEPVVLLHASTPAVWIASAILSRLRRKRVALFFHGEVAIWTLRRSGPLAGLLRVALQSATMNVAVSEPVADALRTLGGVPPERVMVAPAYLEPATGVPPRREPAPATLEFCRAHHPLLLASGAAIRVDGVDLYGVDMALALLERLRRHHPHVGIVFKLMRTLHHDAAYEHALRQRVQASEAAARWRWDDEPGELWPLMREADLLVRPTSSDGDAMTLREAHSVGLPTVASAVGTRPSASRLFRPRDGDDLERAVLETLADLPAARRRALAAPHHSGLPDLLRLIEALRGSPPRP